MFSQKTKTKVEELRCSLPDTASLKGNYSEDSSLDHTCDALLPEMPPGYWKNYMTENADHTQAAKA